MAQRIANKFPIDASPQERGIGLSLPFSAAGVFRQTYTTKDQIKSNLINFFLTNHGERPMKPKYGANLRSDLFEMVNNQTFDLLKAKIQRLLQDNFPNVKLVDLEVFSNDSQNTIQISVYYNVVPFGINDQLNLTFT